MMKLVQLLSPVAIVLFFFALKLPKNLKKMFFKVPIWISSTAIAFLVGHLFLHGVMASYAALIMDAFLMLGLSAIKKQMDWSDRKVETPKLVLETAA